MAQRFVKFCVHCKTQVDCSIRFKCTECKESHWTTVQPSVSVFQLDKQKITGTCMNTSHHGAQQDGNGFPAPSLVDLEPCFTCNTCSHESISSFFLPNISSVAPSRKCMLCQSTPQNMAAVFPCNECCICFPVCWELMCKEVFPSGFATINNSFYGLRCKHNQIIEDKNMYRFIGEEFYLQYKAFGELNRANQIGAITCQAQIGSKVCGTVYINGPNGKCPTCKNCPHCEPGNCKCPPDGTTVSSMYEKIDVPNTPDYGDPFNITVTDALNKRYTISCRTNHTVKQLKDLVANELRKNPQQITLVTAGKVMEDHLTVRHLKLFEKTGIRVVLLPRSQQQLREQQQREQQHREQQLREQRQREQQQREQQQREQHQQLLLQQQQQAAQQQQLLQIQQPQQQYQQLNGSTVLGGSVVNPNDTIQPPVPQTLLQPSIQPPALPFQGSPFQAAQLLQLLNYYNLAPMCNPFMPITYQQQLYQCQQLLQLLQLQQLPQQLQQLHQLQQQLQQPQILQQLQQQLQQMALQNPAQQMQPQWQQPQQVQNQHQQIQQLQQQLHQLQQQLHQPQILQQLPQQLQQAQQQVPQMQPQWHQPQQQVQHQHQQQIQQQQHILQLPQQLQQAQQQQIPQMQQFQPTQQQQYQHQGPNY